MIAAAALQTFVHGAPAVLAEITRVRGSTPRDEGAYMLVSADATIGTIGGGALEYLVIERARKVLRDGNDRDSLDVSLGPEIGQCCGGRVEIAMRLLDEGGAQALVDRAQAQEAARPHVFLFGAGHVGKALARALALLPLRVHAIDTRPDELHDFPDGVDVRAVPMPEAVVRSAPQGSSFVILTHDHALDFLIAAEALRRLDAPYVGMVGSRTKRAKFASWFRTEGGDPDALDRLVLPIGGQGVGDKRPEVIAALAAAEIMVQIGRREADRTARPVTKGALGTVDGR